MDTQPDDRPERDDTGFVLTRKILEMEALCDFGVSISSMLDVDRLTEEVLTRLAVLLELKAGFLLLKEPEAASPRIASRFGIDEEAIAWFYSIDGLISEVLESGQGATRNELGRGLASAPCRHLMLMPLKARGEILGVLGVMDKDEPEHDTPFTPEDERLVSAFANQAGIAISNARLYTHLQDSHRQLEGALDELKTTQKEVIQQERLRALGQMASGVVHDVNNALSAILGYTELWMMFPKMLDSREKILHDLGTINTAAKDATHIIRRLRGFYRPREEGNALIPVALNEVIAQAIDITQPKWHTQASERGAIITIEKALENIPDIEGDDADLREMFINLIFNAVDAMPEGGTLAFRTGAAGEQAVLEVSDTGIGMTEEVREKCLEPFFSTKGERGTGMGLAMVFGIIQRHRGTLDIVSAPGKGTTFRIRFPIPSTRPVVDSRVQQLGLPHALRVLVVEDDAAQLEQIVRHLEEDGHAAVAAASGVEGLEKFHKGQFDVVITDAVMPEMDGFALAKAIKKVAPRKPIILITGYPLPEEEDAGMAGPNAAITVVLQKPIILQLFRRALSQAIETARQR
jgi:signal transduction histidine kinase